MFVTSLPPSPLLNLFLPFKPVPRHCSSSSRYWIKATSPHSRRTSSRSYPITTTRCVSIPYPHAYVHHKKSPRSLLLPVFFLTLLPTRFAGGPRGQVLQLSDDLRRLPRLQSRTLLGPLTWFFDVHPRRARVRSLVSYFLRASGENRSPSLTSISFF